MPERHEVLRQTILHPPYRHPLCADIDCNDPDRLDRVRRHSRAPKLVDLTGRSFFGSDSGRVTASKTFSFANRVILPSPVRSTRPLSPSLAKKHCLESSQPYGVDLLGNNLPEAFRLSGLVGSYLQRVRGLREASDCDARAPGDDGADHCQSRPLLLEPAHALSAKLSPFPS